MHRSVQTIHNWGWQLLLGNRVGVQLKMRTSQKPAHNRIDHIDSKAVI